MPSEREQAGCVLSLEEVCAKMRGKGYEWGGLVSSARQLLPHFSTREELGREWNKPRGKSAMWFSLIVQRYEDSDEEEERTRSGGGEGAPLTLDWVQWLTQEDYQVEASSMKDLMGVCEFWSGGVRVGGA